MQCWSWIDVIVYFASVTLLMFWHLSPLGVLLVLVKLPFFVLVKLPFGVLREFKVTSFERRRANQAYSSFFEYAALSYMSWILHTFRASTCGPIFFGEASARFLYFFRRCKYGTENIGDFEPTPATSSSSFNGYWVRSRSRLHQEPDLVIYFVPGNLAGAASAYIYIEYLCMLLVELQVQGFANPAVLVADIRLYAPGGYVSAFQQTHDGWNYLLKTHPNAATLVKGSGIGGTLLLTLLLHLARPFAALEPEASAPARTHGSSQDITPVKSMGHSQDANQSEYTQLRRETPVSEGPRLPTPDSDHHAALLSDSAPDAVPVRKPDAMFLLSPFPVVWMDHFGRFEDILDGDVLTRLREQLIPREQAYEAWARPGNVRDNDWWKAALPDRGTVIMYGEAELLSHDIAQLVQTLKPCRKLVLGVAAEDQLHAWPVLLSFISRSVTEQMSGIDEVADHIAKMLVMECIC